MLGLGKISTVVDKQRIRTFAAEVETVESEFAERRLVVGALGTRDDDRVEMVAETVPSKDALNEQVRIHRDQRLRSVATRHASG